MNKHLEPKIGNACVMKLTNSVAIGCVSCLAIAHFESQADISRINQRYPAGSSDLITVKKRIQ